ncbi:MAG: hypothetical protein JWO77_3711 [Ilumatobacteraceae bacterium]|nr:hypothetical protein [Ilumatobacteraceae bacterium]
MSKASDLVVVVGGSAGATALGDLEYEVRRTKAALLYADSVEILSPKAINLEARMLYKMRRIPEMLRQSGAGPEVADLIPAEVRRQLGAGLSDEVIAGILLHGPELLSEHMRDKPIPAEAEGQGAFARIEVALNNYFRSEDQEGSPRETAALRDLLRLGRTGFVKLDLADASEVLASDLDSLDEAFDHVVGSLAALLEQPSGHVHPLVAADATGALGNLVGENESRFTLTYANRAEIAARLIAAVPGFPDASVDELVDLRERVSPSLVRFRAAVADLEEEAGASVLDDDFDRSFLDLRLRVVDPALEELRESFEDEGAIGALTRAVPKVSTSLIGFAAALAVHAPDLAGAAALGAGVLAAGADEIRHQRQTQRDRRSNRFFLLTDLEQGLNEW